MWWCCGKTKKEALGCKFSKHKIREENEDEEMDILGANQQVFMKNVKCMCCLQQGHNSANCPNDPNIRTSVPYTSVDKEFSRIRDLNGH